MNYNVQCHFDIGGSCEHPDDVFEKECPVWSCQDVWSEELTDKCFLYFPHNKSVVSFNFYEGKYGGNCQWESERSKYLTEFYGKETDRFLAGLPQM